MPLDRQHQDLAKKLAHLSLGENGQIDQARVDAVLASLRDYKPRLLRPLLKAFLHYLEIEDRRGTMLYEYNGLINPAELENLHQHFNRKYNRFLRLDLKANESLLAGVRVSIADDVFEYSASSRLATLRAAMI